LPNGAETLLANTTQIRNHLCRRKGGFVLDDAYCAGFLVKTLRQTASNNNTANQISDAAQAASKTYDESYPDIISAFKSPAADQCLREINCTEDPGYLAARLILVKLYLYSSKVSLPFY